MTIEPYKGEVVLCADCYNVHNEAEVAEFVFEEDSHTDKVRVCFVCMMTRFALFLKGVADERHEKGQGQLSHHLAGQ